METKGVNEKEGSVSEMVRFLFFCHRKQTLNEENPNRC